MAHFFTEKKQIMYIILLLMIAFSFMCPSAYAQQTPQMTFAPADDTFEDSFADASEYIISQTSENTSAADTASAGDENKYTQDDTRRDETKKEEPKDEADERGAEPTQEPDFLSGRSADSLQEPSGDTFAATQEKEEESSPQVTDAPKITDAPTAAPTNAPTAAPQPTATAVPSPQVRFSRDFSGQYAEYGSYITLSYTVRNDGSLPVTDITVRDGLLGKIGGVDRLDPGEKKTFSASVKITETCTSAPSISYKYAGIGHTRYCSEKTIYLAKVDVSAQIEADKTNVSPGEYVTLRLRIKNEGNVNLYSLRIQEPMLGEIGSTARSLAPGEDFVVTRTVQMKSTAAFHFKVSGSSDTGEAFGMEAEEIGIIVTPAAAQIEMELKAQADREQLDVPGEVAFSLRLNNRCMLELRDVVLSEDSLGEIRRLEFVPAGEMPPITYSCYVAESGTYRFKAQVVDAVGDQLTVYSDPIFISVRSEQAQHSERPQPTQTDAAQSVIEMPDGSPYRMAEEVATFEKLIFWTLVLLIGVLLLWYVVSSVLRFFRRKRRRRRKKNKNKAMGKRFSGKSR